MKEQGNLLLAIVLSLLILLGFQYFFEAPKMKKEVENTLSQLIDQKNFSRIKKLLEYCIQTLKIGS